MIFTNGCPTGRASNSPVMAALGNATKVTGPLPGHYTMNMGAAC